MSKKKYILMVLTSLSFLVLLQLNFASTTDFISLWNVSIDDGVSGYYNLTLPLDSNGNYNFTVYWGDGTSDNITSYDDSDNLHTYSSGGEYTVNISGIIDGFELSGSDDGPKLIDVIQWGNLKINNKGYQFADCPNLLKFSANDSLNLSNITDIHKMFYNAYNFTFGIKNWNTSDIQDMSFMFYNAYKFNENLSDWDTSNVTTMYDMFYKAYAFNGNISNWDTSKVENMESMFYSAINFNQPLYWIKTNTTSMYGMFQKASNFNADLNKLDVSHVTSMENMFSEASSFNKDLNDWNTSQVTTMRGMFELATNFNGNISSWDVHNVTDMHYMFSNDYAFNNDLSKWNISNVEDMYRMLADTNMSIIMYTKLLLGWGSLDSVVKNVEIHVYNNEESSYVDYFNISSSARDRLVNDFSWDINDGDVVYSYISADYVNPIEGNYGNENVLINVSANDTIDSCTLNWNGTKYDMTVNDKICYFNISGEFGNSYEYNVTVIGKNYGVNITRTLNVNLIKLDLNYIAPTPENNYKKFNYTLLDIKFNDGGTTLDNCFVNINGINYSMSYSDGNCEYNYTIVPTNNSYYKIVKFKAYYNISGTIGSLDERTIYSYLKNPDTNNVPGFGLYSIFSTLIISLSFFFRNNLNYRKNKYKKAITPIIAISMLLIVSVSSIVLFNNWFNAFSSNIQAKSINKIDQNNGFDVINIDNDNGTKLYILNKLDKFFLIDLIKINGIECNLTRSDVISENSITKIDLDCPVTQNTLANIIVMTDNYFINKKLVVR